MFLLWNYLKSASADTATGQIFPKSENTVEQCISDQLTRKSNDNYFQSRVKPTKISRGCDGGVRLMFPVGPWQSPSWYGEQGGKFEAFY